MPRRAAACLLLVALAGCGASPVAVGPATSGPAAGDGQRRPPPGAGFPGTAPVLDPYARMLARVPRRAGRALGTPGNGRLVGGVRLPAAGPDHVTWDPITKQRPSRSWRRTGTGRTVRGTLRALRDLRRRRPGLPRVLVGDLSRPRGGDFGARYGIIGHATHQNGRDVDVYWPLRDGRSAVARGAVQVDQRAAAALVRALLRAGATRVLVGPGIRVRGPRVTVVAGHDDHAHATF